VNRAIADGLPLRRYEARKGEVRLALYRKVAPGRAGQAPVVVLVHGSSLCALPTFDLDVPGHPDYSMMDWLARTGFDVWTLDHEGYGDSTRTESNADVATGAADLEAAGRAIADITGRPRAHVYGMSSGALRAAVYAAAYPNAIERLALDAFVWTGEGSPTLEKRRAGLDEFRAASRRAIDRDFVTGIFTRDRPGTTEVAVADACATAQLAYGDSVPTGTYVDMTANLPLVDPAQILVPTLIVRGEFDGIATEADLLAFFARLPSNDKQFSVMPELSHCTTLGVHRRRMWRAVDSFFNAGA
jgi:non-heme chloroperoxidase